MSFKRKYLKEYSMTQVMPTVAEILFLPLPAQSNTNVIQEIVDDLSGSKRIAIIATDGLGLFAWKQWGINMPFLGSMLNRHSIVIRSIMPSITPVNFAAMVTGAELAVHGVREIDNTFSCETIFNVLRKKGKRSAGVGLEKYTGSNLLGRHADIWGNGGSGSDDDIEKIVIEISEHKAPDYLIAQLGIIDDVFHQYGPSSPSVVPMLKDTDLRLKRLVTHLKNLDYGVIILSDHGQHDVPDAVGDEYRGIHGTVSNEDCLVPCTWI
jgi:predicted AlkP superfamily pyrophosphatase or phosphodiesterase